MPICTGNETHWDLLGPSGTSAIWTLWLLRCLIVVPFVLLFKSFNSLFLLSAFIYVKLLSRIKSCDIAKIALHKQHRKQVNYIALLIKRITH